MATTAGLIRGELIVSVDVAFSASKVWEVYANTHQLAQIFKNFPASAFEDIQVVGDGGLGTRVIAIYKPAGNPLKQFTEKVVTLDHERRVKEVEMIEGGFLNFVYIFFLTRFEILPKGPNMATVTRSMLYNLREDSAANLSLVSAADAPDQVKAVEDFLNGSSTSN
ncbi:hypothetical protein H6P81_014884 [Aristolochia fimbriata]|uniref:Bet v I/Major latex protein domain-containing protein n=1 Tax=Aristolochia fimbriata TaxID=158543 RepID=A0AAV7E5S1_ARIFI|nr:hypothetical protein H6P81_014884 [Aristolochia fimbriata]